MATYTQTNRPLVVTTPLSPDVLLLTGFSGQEGLSRLFRFELDLVAENNKEIAFDKLLSQPVSVRLTLPGGGQRYFHGICSRFSQGGTNATFTTYRMEVVPRFWLWTKRAQSRIFQHRTVPDILKEVLDGLAVAFELPGTWHPRDYCVQYRETDFNFASRLMEEEGIYYYFKHTEGGHQMVVAHSPRSHADLPTGSKITYKNRSHARSHDEDFIHDWGKTQEITAGKVSLWDHCFELPHKHLEAERGIQENVQVGQVAHRLKIGENGRLAVHDWPGEYAQRFDGVDRGGGERPAELQKIFEDNQRTAGIRMQQEAATGVVVQGASNCRQLVSGHKFTLITLETDRQSRPAKADGEYVLTTVSHRARMGHHFRSGGGKEMDYSNTFTCLPIGLPFRPTRSTPRPVVPGSQTAVVVGPPGEEIFTDKYSRVKVQFHWDRQGKYDADSSCWVRVATTWAGKQWGFIQVPRIGQEVIVDFLEGDPDQPIIVGSVYNAEQMPPLKLPDRKMVSGLKTNSTPGGGGYNGLTFDDTKGEEKISLHGQYDMDTTIEHNDTQTVHNDRTIKVEGKHTEHVRKDTTIKVLEGNLEHKVLTGTASYYVAKAVEEKFDATQDTTVKEKITIKSTESEILIDASKKITLHTGKSTITLEADGNITLDAVNIKLVGSSLIKSSAPAVEAIGEKLAKMAVPGQSVVCSPGKVETSATAIATCAQAVHDIRGALIKIN